MSLKQTILNSPWWEFPTPRNCRKWMLVYLLSTLSCNCSDFMQRPRFPIWGFKLPSSVSPFIYENVWSLMQRRKRKENISDAEVEHILGTVDFYIPLHYKLTEAKNKVLRFMGEYTMRFSVVQLTHPSFCGEYVL